MKLTRRFHFISGNIYLENWKSSRIKMNDLDTKARNIFWQATYIALQAFHHTTKPTKKGYRAVVGTILDIPRTSMCQSAYVNQFISICLIDVC